MPCTRLGLRINGPSLETTPLLRDERRSIKSYSTTVSYCEVDSSSFLDSDSITGSSTPLNEEEPPESALSHSDDEEPIESSEYYIHNTSGAAQDHLVAECTFLAYVQTSLAIATAGIALAQSFMVYFENHPPTKVAILVAWLGGAGTFLSVWMLRYGHRRYFDIRRALSKSKYPVAHIGLTGIALALGGIIICTFVAILMSWREQRPWHRCDTHYSKSI
ncbi:hypothetical protein HGRIS_012251 [Hohenbuehelia grisea]|uniref:DUF202 domain-containing protein n=1 Tax=Hohenbuehelia grisea TaxID=104357 RepID=A0ABR3IRR0_9AGAR